MPADALAGIFMNVKGEQFLPMMQSNRPSDPPDGYQPGHRYG